MSKKVEIKINPEGLLELFKDPAIQEACVEVAEEVATMSGKDYRASKWKGPNRAGAAVWINSEEAMQDNLENNTLLKKLGTVVPTNKIKKM